MNFKFDKEMFAKVGDGAWRLTKHIVKKGIQQTVMETAGSATLAALEGDMNHVKQKLTFDAIVGPKKVKVDKPKKKWFGKKEDKVEELLEEVTEAGEATMETLEEITEEVKAEDVKVEVIDKKKDKKD